MKRKTQMIDDDYIQHINYPYFTRSQAKRHKAFGEEKKVNDITSTKNYLKEMNQTSPWLMKDGKKMYKDAYGQTCYQYVCPFQDENGKFCGLKPFLPKDSISMKGYCRKHKEFNDN